MSNPEFASGKPLEQRITPDQTTHFDREGFSGNWYVGNGENRGFSALVVNVHGEHPRKRMGENTTRTYFVIEGEGMFTIGGQTFEVSKGDYFVIEPGGEYNYSGNMKLLETNISSDNSFEDEKI